MDEYGNHPVNHPKLANNLLTTLREGVKYYFADFVRKGGTPPTLRTKFSPKKITDLGGTPPPPLWTFPRKFSSKRAKNCVFFAQKTPDFVVMMCYHVHIRSGVE